MAISRLLPAFTAAAAIAAFYKVYVQLTDELVAGFGGVFTSPSPGSVMNPHRPTFALSVLLFAVPPLLFAVPSLVAGPPDELRPRSVWNIRFNGLQHFESSQLHQALALNGAVQRAADAAFTDEEFQQTVVARLRDGYRHRGFADARLRAERSGDDQFLTIHIEAGIRYRCAAVKVEATESDRAQGLDCDRLQLGLTMRSGAETDKTIDTSDESFWQADDFADFSEDYRHGMHRRVLRLLREQGFHFPDVLIELQPDRVGKAAHLLVDIRGSGKRQSVAEIRFEGLSRHSEAQIQEFLNLPDQLYAGRAMEANIANQLLDTGRFVFANVTSQTPFDADQKVDLTVRLEEYEHAPMLGEELSEQQQVLARLAKWMRELSAHDCDLQLKVTLSDSRKVVAQSTRSLTQNLVQLPTSLQPDSISLELLFAAAGGGIFHLTARQSDQNIVDVTGVSMNNRTGLIDENTGEMWFRKKPFNGTNAVLRLEGRSPDENGKRFHLFAGLGVVSHRTPPGLRVVTNPAALFNFLHETEDLRMVRDGTKARFEFSGSDLTVDTETGALVSAHIEADNLTIDAAGAHGLVRERLSRIETAAASNKNRFDETAPATSLIAFAVDGISEVLKPVNDDLPAVAKLVFRLLKDPQFLAEAGERMEQLFDADRFRIPVPESQHNALSARKNHWQLHAVKGLVPVSSGPHRLLSAVLHAQESRTGEPLRNVVAEIQQDDAHGVATCLLTGLLLKDTRRQIAAAGLQRLEAGTVPPEILQLVSEPCVLAHLLTASIETIQQISDDEFELLITSVRTLGQQTTGDLPPPEVLAGIAALQLVRRHPATDPTVTAQELMTLAWHTMGRAQAEQILRSWLPPAKPRTIRPVSGRRTKAAGKSKKSAAQPLLGVEAIELPDPTQSIFRPKTRFQK